MASKTELEEQVKRLEVQLRHKDDLLEKSAARLQTATAALRASHEECVEVLGDLIEQGYRNAVADVIAKQYRDHLTSMHMLASQTAIAGAGRDYLAKAFADVRELLAKALSDGATMKPMLDFPARIERVKELIERCVKNARTDDEVAKTIATYVGMLAEERASAGKER